MTRSLVTVLLAVSAAAACAAGRGRPNASPPPGADALPVSGRAGAVPPALDAVESAAEDAYDHALAGRTGEAARDARRLESSWQAFRPRARSAGASPALVTEVDSAVAALGRAVAAREPPVAVARAANAVSGRMEALFALYHPVTPAGLLALDYLGREIALDGMQGDLAAARADLERTAARWQALRPEVVSAGGPAAADRYQASLGAVGAALDAGDAARVVSAADASLEDVDRLERVFARGR